MVKDLDHRGHTQRAGRQTREQAERQQDGKEMLGRRRGVIAGTGGDGSKAVIRLMTDMGGKRPLHSYTQPMRINALACIIASLILAACDPFTASGAAVSEDRIVPQTDVPKFELLTPKRRLPHSAHNVRTRFKHFQDTRLEVRFDADLAEARRFAEQLTGKPPGRTDYFALADGDPDWWITEGELKQAEWSRDDVVDGDGLPYSSVALVRRENGQATVWVRTWTT